MNNHEMPMDEKLFELMYELIDIEEIEKEGYRNMVDISVEGNQTYLLGNGILSHNSAKNSVSKILGRQGNGFFAMFGVPPNAYDSDIKKLMSSDKIKDLMRVLNLKLSETKQTELNFQEIIITSDFDLPGHFIAGQLIGLFARFGRNLFDEGRIKRFITPLIIAKDNKGNILKWFFSFDEYREFENTNTQKLIYDYKKGFGAWDREELEFIIKKVGFENMLETFTLDDESIKELDNWLISKNSDIRKEMLEGYEFNIMGI